MSHCVFEVPIQPYAGQLLVIKDLIYPKAGESGPRTSYFDRGVIAKKLLKHLLQAVGDKSEKISMLGHESLVEGCLHALEAYMKMVAQKVIELCEHRTSYKLYMNPRFTTNNDMRSTMTFLNDLGMADLGSSDDDDDFYRNVADLERKNRKDRREPKQPREPKVARESEDAKTVSRGLKNSADNIAMMAFGSRKRPANDDIVAMPGAFGGLAGANPTPLVAPRLKHVTIKDVLQFMEEDKHYCRSNMLSEAYLKYTI